MAPQHQLCKNEDKQLYDVEATTYLLNIGLFEGVSCEAKVLANFEETDDLFSLFICKLPFRKFWRGKMHLYKNFTEL